MNSTDQLDSFEAALLTELRREVTEQPALAPVPARRPRTRLRLAAIGAAGVAASVVAVFGVGSSGGAPAYAVEKNSSGDILVTVHRLDDASGLEGALRAKGIDADVSYDADGFGPTIGMGPDGAPLPGGRVPPAAGQGGLEDHVETQGGTGTGPTEAGPGSVGPAD